MRHMLALAVLTAALAAWAGAVHACHHDILCPEQWVWSDAENSCVEAEPGTS